MAYMTTVWVFSRIPELNNRTGFVECDEELAAQLIAAGRVQDPRIGATALRYIEDVAPPSAPPPGRPAPRSATDARYDDKQMVAKRK